MGEETMVMISGHHHKLNNHSTQNSSWKLYQNPYYRKQPQHNQQDHHQHHLLSARKLAASLWDLTFIRSIMDSELDMARTRIHELKAELEHERRTRKKVESLNKKLCKQILEERKKREAVEDVCEKLAKEISSEKIEIDRMKKDIVEERKMLRVAEVLREERVQMKLSEAKFLFEEKLSELETSKVSSVSSVEKREVSKASSISNESARVSNCSIENSSSSNILASVGSTSMNKRRASPEPENPHIKRGIKGFVEFPRVVKAISSRGRQLGSKVECQKAQLRLLLRQKSPFRSDHLIMG